MGKLDVAMKIAEKHQEREMSSKIKARMRASVADIGGSESLRRAILTQVSSENYQEALEDLKIYLESRHEYPQFRVRTERYFSYAVDLVNAIRAKRSFPGLQHLSMAKQQELYDRAMEHFEDLKVTIRKIEHIEREVKLDDVRSTVWVVKASIYCIFAVLILAFLIESSRGILPTAYIVFDGLFSEIVNWVFDVVGL